METVDLLEEAKKAIKESVSKSKLPEKEKEELAKVLEKIFVEGVPAHQALGLSQKTLDFIYGEAYRFYVSGKYQKAFAYFYLLDLFDPGDIRYLTAMAASQMKLEKREDAAVSYTLLSNREPKNPFNFFYLGLLYGEMGKPNASYYNFLISKELCGDTPEFAQLKERITLNLQALEKEGALA